MSKTVDYTSKSFKLLAYCDRCGRVQAHDQEYRYGESGKCFYKCEPTCAVCGNRNTDGAFRACGSD